MTVILVLGGLWGGIKQATRSVAHWVSSAVSSGVGQQEAYDDIADVLSDDVDIEEFLGQYDLYQDALPTWDKIKDIPETHIVSEEFALPTSLDYRRNHIMKMKVSAYDVASENFVEQWITVESDKLLTRAEWEREATKNTLDTLAGTNLVIVDILETQYYVKQGTF